jgi:hypothetical protein
MTCPLFSLTRATTENIIIFSSRQVLTDEQILRLGSKVATDEQFIRAFDEHSEQISGMMESAT